MRPILTAAIAGVFLLLIPALVPAWAATCGVIAAIALWALWWRPLSEWVEGRDK